MNISSKILLKEHYNRMVDHGRETTFPFLSEEDFIGRPDQHFYIHVSNLQGLRNDPEASDSDEDEDLQDVNYS
jgi:hypothetical protein